MAYRSLTRDLAIISERMSQAQLQISSGKRVNKPSDDPVAAADVIRINSEKSEIAQYLENIATGKARLEFIDTTLQNVQTVVERVRSLALQSLGNVASANLYTSEAEGLREQVLTAANSTFQGQFVFAGSRIDQPAYTKNSTGTVTYAGDSVEVEVQVGRSLTLQTQLPGSDVFSGNIDIFATIQNVIDAMNAGDKAAISAQVANLEQFTAEIGTALGKVGGLVNVAQSIQGDLTRYNLARSADLVRLEDADLPTALTNFTQAETALRAATAAGARISNLSILDYLT
jgi:flagellar hook-associated protein 3 FlgL